MTEEEGRQLEGNIPHEQAVLIQAGDFKTFSGKHLLHTPNSIHILMGSNKTDPDSVQKSKAYTLHYTDEYNDKEGVKRPQWVLVDNDNRPDAWILEDGLPFPVGTLNIHLFPSRDVANQRRFVSQTHLAVVTAGNKATIWQRSQMNPTFITSPARSSLITGITRSLPSVQQR